jgi:hypothetical protein
MVPEDGDSAIMLSYTKDEENVWVIPMTSLSSADHSVMGLLVYETQENKAKFYPGLHGFNHGGSVSGTMYGIPGNKQNNYQVENLELYNIFGKLTWVGIYTHAETSGSTFGGIGFMNAHAQAVTEVAYADTVQEALGKYTGLLARGSDGMHQTDMSNIKKFDGVVWRIGQNAKEGDWQFRILGNSHVFSADISTYAGIALVRDGDLVKGAYLDTGNETAHVRELENLSEPDSVKALKLELPAKK